jgi:hypothetical protein
VKTNATRNSTPASLQKPRFPCTRGVPGVNASLLTASTQPHSCAAPAARAASVLIAQPRPRTAKAAAAAAVTICTVAAQAMRKGKTRTWMAQKMPNSQICLAIATSGMSAAQRLPSAAARSTAIRLP